MDLEKLHALLEKEKLELVIGVETHARLNTNTKLFCSCPNEENPKPNTNICSVCTGQMGSLPVINKSAVEKAIRFGLAVNSSFANKVISWDRKHYEYPDNPKNIQITQYHNPVIPDGFVECYRDDGSVFKVEIEQVHIEEDAAKLSHSKDYSLVDFNKAGVPLIEIVTKPCLKNIKDVATYTQNIQRIVQNLGISNAHLEKGEFKSDVSVSLRKKGSQKLNARTEIKNLNSFKFIVESLKEEVCKQLEYYKKNQKFRSEQTTVLWDETLKKTQTMRQKEYDADYRFIRESDLPIVDIEHCIANTQIDTNKLPFTVESLLIKDGVKPQDAKFFTTNTNHTNIFSTLNEKLKDALFVAKTLTNTLKTEDYSFFIHHTKVLCDLFLVFQKKEIPQTLLKETLHLFKKNSDFDYRKYIRENHISEDQILKTLELVFLKTPKL